MRLHGVAVSFGSNTVSFCSQCSITYCHDAAVTIRRVTEEPSEPVYTVVNIFEPQIRPARPFQRNIVMVNGYLFFQTIKREKLAVFKAPLYDNTKAIEEKHFKERPLEESVSEQYHEFLPLFNMVLADRLQPHRLGIDHEVHLKDGETPTWEPLYSMSRAELVVLKEWPEENVSKEFIRQSSSPFSAPVLCAKKLDGKLRFCIDYQDINSKIIKNRYSLPLIMETSYYLGKARIHSKQDVRGAYNLFRVEEGDEHQLAFRT